MTLSRFVYYVFAFSIFACSAAKSVVYSLGIDKRLLNEGRRRRLQFGVKVICGKFFFFNRAVVFN